MANIAGSLEGPISALVDSIPTYPITPDIRVPFRHDPAVLDAIAESFPDERVSRIDGVRVDFGDGWGLARLSVTEPVITLRFEAHTEERLRKIIREFTDPVPELQERVIADLKTL
jgi:phosphomannomutase/phosphoglucomutase